MEGRPRRSFRSSTRSRESSSTSDVSAREKIKDCCRKLVAFMCTQVGVGGLVVGYTAVGAFTFRYIETLTDDESYLQVEEARNRTATELFQIVCKVNVFNRTVFEQEINSTLRKFQDKVANETKLHGYSGRKNIEIWTYPAALMFCLSVITMVGYGNMVARSDLGKCVTVIYAMFGIPLYVLYFMNMGEVLAGCFRWLYTWCYECTTERDESEPPRRVIVPTTASLWVIGVYVFTGAIMFAAWENWSYLDSTYFCVTSLCKIGLGDFVPGANISESKGGNYSKLVVNFIYMLIGLGLVAMCYNLMREEIRVKVSEFKEDMGQCLEDTRQRFLNCCKWCRRNK
ncbi:TWiK family of potassium channels protein 18 [Onthophagus taurus]|uniref:TWiK family of potassium channels protein 18 n=1 Tax=Onthophagus taurus TaxID=166361 RepID=UPI000C20F95F|nr:TWiK family of potassium channels protein 18 [Onthophagus taurus]